MAQFFSAEGKSRKAVQYFRKCLELAVGESDPMLEAEINLSLGLAYEDLKDVATAISFYERHLLLVNNAGDMDADATGRHHLIRVLVLHSQELEKSGELDGCIANLRRCLEVAVEGDNREAQGVAHQGLGSAYERLRDTDSALNHYEEFREISMETDNEPSQAQAYAALATIYQELGDLNSASENLASLLAVAQRTSDLAGQARAAASLGVIAQKLGRFADAADNFAVSFEAAQKLGDRKMLDVARVNMGLARGAGASGLLFSAVKANDMTSLLNWKISRVPLGYVAGREAAQRAVAALEARDAVEQAEAAAGRADADGAEPQEGSAAGSSVEAGGAGSDADAAHSTQGSEAQGHASRRGTSSSVGGDVKSPDATATAHDRGVDTEGTAAG